MTTKTTENNVAQLPVTATKDNSVLVYMAEKYGMAPAALEATLRATVMPSDKAVSREQFAAFLLVAKEYDLNPLTKEIYAFPGKNNSIQPIVSIDGWLRMINQHPQMNGMQFVDNRDGTKLVSVTCRIFRKDREHAIEVTEYMAECVRNTEPWQKWPARMLRHKAAIQAGRYAFGFSGIYDQDEIERMHDGGAAGRPTSRTEEVLGKLQKSNITDVEIVEPTQAPEQAVAGAPGEAEIIEDVRRLILNAKSEDDVTDAMALAADVKDPEARKTLIAAAQEKLVEINK